MSTFEFISVFISMIFGLGLAHLFTNAMAHVFQRKLNYERGAYLLFTTMIVLGQWWTLFRWRDVQTWTFEAFAVLVLWALTVFAMPVALYPPGEDVHADIKHRRTFLALFLVMGVLDVAQTAMLGALFEPKYYLIFVGHYIAIAALGIASQSPRLHNVIATYLAASLTLWMLVVRRLLA